MTKNELPTVSIKGKDYVLVKDRVTFFNDEYPAGSIVTELVSYENGQAVVKATVTPDVEKPARIFTGWSQARENDGYINKTAALENCESSAVGRALALMGIGVIDSIASADEVHKATIPVTAPVKPQGNPEPVPWEQSEATSAVEKKLGITPQEAKDIEDSVAETEASEYPETKACETCGEIATFREGVSSKTGKEWKAYFCSSDDKSHTKFVS